MQRTYSRKGAKRQARLSGEPSTPPASLSRKRRKIEVGVDSNSESDHSSDVDIAIEFQSSSRGPEQTPCYSHHQTGISLFAVYCVV
ncbi:hypothetical protein K474DRAFT_1228237 [Panus rudis PR-1116 ss-1]|nr:hypothetical protein K474DRAFT_1228237 [Panus rudis PR-1116 ss-1]